MNEWGIILLKGRCYRDGRVNYDGCLNPLNRQPIPTETLDQIFSDEKDRLRHRYANNIALIDNDKRILL